VDGPVVLLVEDQALVLMVAQEALEAGGYSVLIAQDGADATTILDAQAANLAGLVTDVQLGGDPDGWEVARHARELRSDLPVVYMTGDSAADWSVQGVPNSVVVQKPYAPAQLVTAISALMTAVDTNRAS
jgi:CheY-like chemotaxis protein